MGRKLLFLSIVACLMIGAAQGAFANDRFRDWAGAWDRNAPGTTTQAWEFGNGPGPATHNPYGTAVVHVVGAESVPGGLSFIGGGSISFTIPNNPVPNPYKLMFIQITSSKAISNTGGLPIIAASGTVTTRYGPTIYDEGGGFHTYSWISKIEPNPNSEDITFNFYPDTIVEEIVIDTICVPEPGSMVAMFSALVGLVGFGIRRRK